MIDQLIIGRKASHDDFGASVASRKIEPPAKKKITETVPFSNALYDFTAINGEIYWDWRKIEYTLEMIAENPVELEEMKTALSGWFMNVMEEEIHDPFMPEHHFIGTFDSLSYDDDESVEKTTATVTFLAYPYRIANRARTYTNTIGAGGTVTVKIRNESSHKIVPTVTTNAAVTIEYGGASFGLAAGTYTDETIMLDAGVSECVVMNTSNGSCTVTISFIEEVF